ncbi:hypothetical protein J8I87_06525 [Paraburkholderia sp. LEh10]|uniref:hypothetical protein n=1 Tax=Paraburkholderia sp. LEh10 TaxID=2821353 RepID=UPI001AEA7364|nr:hypothetical protein [Paraburkholderia sp. LEh10]MBP0589379.1 hypothetical protein [Paraburkholderia sp. LEh10]
MKTLLIKDLPRIEEIDRQTAMTVRGGILKITKPIEPAPLPTLPGIPSIDLPPLSIPPIHVGKPVPMPYEGALDPRLQ